MDQDLLTIQEMRDAVKEAKMAQEQYLHFSQEQVDRIVKEVSEAAYNEAGTLARLAVYETGMGVEEHKTMKNKLCSRDLYEHMKDEKTVGIIGQDRDRKLTEIAYPFGVIAGIIPTTNPTSTAIFKTLNSLKTRNAIVVSPHPSAKKCTVEALKVCRKAAENAGAPTGIIGWLSEPTLESTTSLMHHRDVNLILATGGGGLVRAAYSSGKPAYGVGPGNVPVYIEKTANVRQAVKMACDSKTFDNGTLCSSEQALVVDKNIKEMVVRELKNNGAYFLGPKEKRKVEDVISPMKGKLNPNIVGKAATYIAGLAGIEVPEGTRLLIAEETKIAKNIPFSIEKLSPIFALYTSVDYQEAKQICLAILNLGGKGHSFSIHTTDESIVQEFGLSMPVSRMLVNTLSSIGAAGGTTGLAPSMTLGCGSFGGNITSDNITARHLLNIKRVAYGIKDIDIPRPDSVRGSGTKIAEAAEVNENIEEAVNETVKSLSISKDSVDTKKVSEIVEKVLKHYQEV